MSSKKYAIKNREQNQFKRLKIILKLAKYFKSSKLILKPFENILKLVEFF